MRWHLVQATSTAAAGLVEGGAGPSPGPQQLHSAPASPDGSGRDSRSRLGRARGPPHRLESPGLGACPAPGPWPLRALRVAPL